MPEEVYKMLQNVKSIWQAIRYKFLNGDVYIMQLDHQYLEKCINRTSFISSILFCDVLLIIL